MDGIKRGIKVEFDDNDVIQVEMFGTTDDFIEAIATVLNAISIKTNASIDYLLGRVGLRIVSNNLASEIEEEVEEAIAKEVLAHPRYVMTGVTINWNAEILSTIKHVFWLRTETEERVRRVKEREEKRWGDRVTEGGDMYEQQKSFRELIAGLTEDKVQRSIDKLDCEVIQIDGTRSVSDNLSIIMKIVMG